MRILCISKESNKSSKEENIPKKYQIKATRLRTKEKVCLQVSNLKTR